MDDRRGEDQGEPGKADARVLGQLLAAQSILSVLPTAQHVAGYFAQALLAVPGVTGVRACLPGVYARERPGGDVGSAADGCADCPKRGWTVEEAAVAVPDLRCRLVDVPRLCVVDVETETTRFGSFVLEVEDEGFFERYRPFVQNLLSVVAISLENRLQRERLGNEREALERKVVERTAELRSTNRRLEEEIEQRRRAEAAVRELNAELERRVRDRTAELAAANQELEAFAYSVSHDLRAPLRHITGFLELLTKRAGTLDAQSRHYVAVVSEAATRMGAMIDDLLAFSRMGRQELSRASVDLGELAREVIAELEPEARDRTVRWQVGALPVVGGDRALLRIVLVNLLSNALKFTRPRAEAVIELGREDGPGGELVVFVRDNGVGFDMAYADKLFRVFERLHRAVDFEGTGVGLANVRRVVERHGGRAWADGLVGQGATFRFSLPRP